MTIKNHKSFKPEDIRYMICVGFLYIICLKDVEAG